MITLNFHYFKKTRLFIVLGVVGLVMGCGPSMVKIRPLRYALATQKMFHARLLKVQNTVDHIFTTGTEGLFQELPSRPPMRSIFWKNSPGSSAIKLFKNHINENDAYILCVHGPICRSTVYRDWFGRPLDYYADFQVHIVSLGSKETLVKVVALDPRVSVGKRVGSGPSGLCLKEIFVTVAPATVEENQVLERLSDALRSGSKKSKPSPGKNEPPSPS